MFTQTTRAGPELDAVVEAAKELHTTHSVEVFWKTTTSRAAGAAWVRAKSMRVCPAVCLFGAQSTLTYNEQQVNDTAPRDAFLRAGLKTFDASLFTVPLRNHSEVRERTASIRHTARWFECVMYLDYVKTKRNSQNIAQHFHSCTVTSPRTLRLRSIKGSISSC